MKLLKIGIGTLFLLLFFYLIVPQVSATVVNVTDQVTGTTITSDGRVVDTYRIEVYEGNDPDNPGELIDTFDGTRDAFRRMNGQGRGVPGSPAGGPCSSVIEGERYDRNHEAPPGDYDGSRNPNNHIPGDRDWIQIGDKSGPNTIDRDGNNRYDANSQNDRAGINFHPLGTRMEGCIGITDGLFNDFYDAVNNNNDLINNDVRVRIQDRYDSDGDGSVDSQDIDDDNDGRIDSDHDGMEGPDEDGNGIEDNENSLDSCDPDDGDQQPPGGDHPDDNFDVSTISPSHINSGRDYGYSKISILLNGFPAPSYQLLKNFDRSIAFVKYHTSLDELSDYPILVIPSGGLYGIDSSTAFKSKLEQYVCNGGTLIVFSQQHGYEYNALPGGEVSGYGWIEDQSCHYSSVYTDTYHIILSEQDTVTSDVNVDGFFTKYPENATILLSRTKNGMPAMLMYEYGNGTVIATATYTDWAYSCGQETQDGKNLVRDMITWANDPKEISDYMQGNTINFSINITNHANATADQVVFGVVDPDKNIFDHVNVSTSIFPNETKTINFTYTAPSKLGIWGLDYALQASNGTLYDEEWETDPCPRELFGIWVEYDVQRFAVSKYAENPEGFVYQGTDITFTISSPEEQYAYGSDVSFTIHIWNKRDIDRDILVKTSYEDWSLSSVPLEKVNETITVPANGDATYTHTVNVGDIHLSHNQLIISAEFYEDESNLGRTEKVVWMFAPSVNVHVETDQREYAKGEEVSVSLNLTNKRSATCNATVTVRALDPDNKKIYEDSFNVNFSAGASETKTLVFSLPSDAGYGISLVTAEAYKDGNKIGSDSAYFEVPKDYIAVLSFDKPDKAYNVRQNMSVYLNITNVGAALWNSTVNISIPDLAFEDSKFVVVNPNETEKISYNLSIPENLTAGKHDVIVTIGFDHSKMQYYFVIPDSNLILSSERTSYNAGEYLYFDLTNIGGVDTTYNCSIKFYDSRGLRIYGNDTHGTILAGGTQTHSYKIPEQAVSGNYYLMVTCKDLNTNKITRLSKSHTIRGLKAALTSVTDQIVYPSDENISILTNITNLDGAITNGILNLKILCPYIQNSASKMPSSNANINRTARLKILEQKDIDIDYNYRDSMMHEPYPDQMSMSINESEDFTPPLPKHYNFSFPFELGLPVEEEINESSRPQRFSSASMEIRNETVWKDEVKILNDNLIINSTGNLSLINTTLIMNCSSDGEYRIEVQYGGEMHIFDKSNITAMNPLYAFCFQVYSGSTFEMSDSELHGCGYGYYPLLERMGLWINTNDAIIENNSMTDNDYGIILYQSSNSTIVNNDVSLCDAGISLYSSSYNSITGNNASSNSVNGISLSSSSNNNIITSNNVSSNYHGISLSSSSNNNITGNNASLNSYRGIYLSSSSKNNITGNNVSSNYHGIYLSV
jgi:parallel beta-helix repeat protein